LHEKGRKGIEDRIVRLLVNRLRMQRDITRHPEILSQTLLPPAAIIGLPRSGSTKLQRLLAAGRGFHELLMWQAFNPAPLPCAARHSCRLRAPEWLSALPPMASPPGRGVAVAAQVSGQPRQRVLPRPQLPGDPLRRHAPRSLSGDGITLPAEHRDPAAVLPSA